MEVRIYFRHDRESEAERDVAQNYFEVSPSRIGMSNSLVIARYSALPFYKELENDMIAQGSRLINTHSQHKYIADFEYYHDIEDLTPKTYFDARDIPENSGPLIVKGATNSRKFDWDKLMFAPNKAAAINIAYELRKDALIQAQDILFRKYEELEILEVGINGLPFANEWRFFCLGEKILSYGFYWTLSEKTGLMDSKGIELVQEVARRVKDRVNFFVVDIARKKDDSWIVIEMNDGQMSGLSGNEPSVLYSELANNIGFFNLK